ncbi:MAG: diguanylate cyclase, partial [Clostridiales bacterium]|nr:diguanylate cyclase [Clostridiales bacterium]
KATNDTKGHVAGDAMLKDVASMLNEYTTDEKAEIYRVGGDEFLIITPGMESGDFEEYVKALRANCERPGRSHFAVGACHSKDAEGSDIRKAMQKADAEMYDIKEEYYSRHPEMNWHNKIV